MAKYYTQIAWQVAYILPTVTATGDPATGLYITAQMGVDGGTKAPSVYSVKEELPGEYELQLDTTELPAGATTLDLTYSTTTPGITIPPETIDLNDPAALSADTQYCTVDDIYNRFGSENVNKWADLNNMRKWEDITQTIIDTIVTESAIVNGNFRNSKYQAPFASPYPQTITQITRLNAGVSLHNARGIEDNDETIDSNAKLADMLTRQIHAGQLELDLPATKTGLAK